MTRLRRRAPGPDAFGILGLDPSPDLTDQDVRAAWRQAASQTHPDREDGGDPARFAAAAAAYTALRTRSGRGEALADMGLAPRPARQATALRSAVAWRPALPTAAAALAARVRRGRPLRLALRILAAASASAAAVLAAGPHPAAASPPSCKAPPGTWRTTSWCGRPPAHRSPR
jgi:hypothetical protein